VRVAGHEGGGGGLGGQEVGGVQGQLSVES
jgi:hypothetical protein